MSAIDLSAIGLQIALPHLLLAWLIVAPLRSRLGFVVQALTTGLVLGALLLVSVWMMPPWWTPYVYFVIWLLILVWRSPRRFKRAAWLPKDVSEWAGMVVLAPFSLWAGSLIFSALDGRSPPPGDVVVDIAFPMGAGDYLIVNGGANAVINGHYLTLDPETERQRAYRGQSYGVDLIKLGQWGLRASGWRPTDPAAYAIFGETVYAPCSGTVRKAADGMADMPVPTTDRSRLEGNHVLIQCGGFAVLLAHFKRGSVRVAPGDDVSQGQIIGQAGNSGQTTEPHLHIHMQRLPDDGPLLSGEPVFLTFDGELLVRNERLEINAQPALQTARDP